MKSLVNFSLYIFVADSYKRRARFFALLLFAVTAECFSCIIEIILLFREAIGTTVILVTQAQQIFEIEDKF